MNRDDLAFIREIWSADIVWIYLAQDRHQWLFHVNLVTERRNPQKTIIYLPFEPLLPAQEALETA
jgi:hypothetical protein